MTLERSAGSRLRTTLRGASLALRLTWRAGRVRALLVLLASLVSASSVGALVLLLREGVGSGLREAEGRAALGDVLLPLAPVVGVLVVRSVLLAFYRTESEYLGIRTENLCSAIVLTAGGSAELAAYDSPAFSQRIARAEAGAQRAHYVVLQIMSFLGNVVSLGSLAAAMTLIDPLLVLVVVGAAIPGWWLSARQARARSDQFDTLSAARRLQFYLHRSLTQREAAAEVRAYGMVRQLVGRWQAAADTCADEVARLARRAQGQSLLLEGGQGLALALAALVIVNSLRVGDLDVAGTLAALYGLQAFRSQAAALQSNNTAVYEAGLYLCDLRELEASVAEIREDGLPVPHLEKISAHSLQFTYPGSSSPAIDGVSLEVRRGEIVALVGANGSGKSTLAKLLGHLYSPDEGELRWNDVDTRSLRGDEVRARIAIALQDFVRWAFSARDNVALGRPDEPLDEASVMTAASAAGIDGTLTALPDGYATVLSTTVGTAGVDLSTGQWQRVALARMFYRDAPLVILDEPSASLDPLAERDLFTRLKDHYRGRAVLFISHRFSTTRDADRIYVLDRGRIVETGTHAELMASPGLYADMYRLQASTYADPEPTAAP